MRAYWELTKSGFRQYARYRSALVASAFTNTIFGLIRASVLLAALALNQGTYAGYDVLRAATFVWLGQALLGPLDIWGGATAEFGAKVKSGDIAVDFLRPVSILGASLSRNYGRAAFEFLPRSLPPLVVGALLTGLYVPRSPATFVLALASIVLAIAVVHCFFFAVQLSALWLIDNRGVQMIALCIQQIFSGFLVPVPWFPAWLRRFADVSPFPAMLQTPTDVILERQTGIAALLSISGQLLWLSALVGMCLLLLHLGRRKLVIQGG